MFDLADPTDFEGEQALWLAAVKALPPGGILDTCMPKPTAEVLIAGHARPAGGEPTTLMQVVARIGDYETRLAVVGDRVWQAGRGGYTPTAPRPFVEMPLVPARAFGGVGHATNPVGAGYRALPRLLAGELVALPNIEVPGRGVQAIEDEPPPALFGAMELDSPLRRRYAGTYDRRWLETVAPALPDDVDPRLFMHGHRQNWLDGYLSGDEAFALAGFHEAYPSLTGRLPAMRVRAFITRTEDRDALIELPMVIDTLWLLAGARRGILIYRGALPVDDIEGRDVADVVLAYERSADPPRPVGDYAAFRRLRCDPETAQRVGLSEGPLVPAKPEDAVRRRTEARQRAAEAEAARQHAAQVFLLERQLREAGVPEVLWPEVPPPPPPQFLLPTPEEIAAGDLDLGEILDAVEAMRRQAEAELKKAQTTQTEVDLDLQALSRPGATTGDVDRLLDRLAALGSEMPAAQIDAQLRDAAAPPLAEAVDPAAAELIAAMDGKAQDWRQLVLDAARAPTKSAAQEAEAALARALGLPEGSPFAEIRTGLAEMSRIDLPALADASDVPAAPPPPATGPADLRGMLDGLVADAGKLASAGPGSADKLGEIDGQLVRVLPGLRDAADPLAALLEALTASASAPPPPSSPAEALEWSRASVAENLKQSGAAIDAAEERLGEALTSIRSLSPTAMFPEEPLSPAAARMFGDRLLAAIRGGLVPAGRDLAGIDLLGADLTGVDLRGCLMEGAVLTGARLAGAATAGIVLTGANLDDADLSGCDLSGANLAHASGRRARLTGCNLAGARFDEIVLDGAILDRCRFRRGSLIKASLASIDLSGADLTEMTFIECDLTDATMTGATITATQFLLSTLSGVRAAGAVIRETTFINTRGDRIDFRGARLDRCGFLGESHLSGACLEGVEATDATWNGGDLAGARFRRARFTRALFAASDLTGADFRLVAAPGIRLDDCRLVAADFAAADLRGAQMHRADMTAASFRGANLYGCDLTDATLAGCDLAGANLAKTVIAMVGTHVD